MTNSVLYVRGVNEKVRQELNDQAKKKGVSPASIIEGALKEWVENRKEIPARHHVVLYSDKNHLVEFVKTVGDVTKDQYLQVCCGPPSHEIIKQLKSLGWGDITVTPYEEMVKKQPEKYVEQIFDKLSKDARKTNKPICYVGLMTEDIAVRFSLEKSNNLEHKYNKKNVRGITFCPYEVKKLVSAGMPELIRMLEEHERVFFLKDGKEIYEIDMNQIDVAKALV